jgi:Mrp family chromosome partitioning ATPase
MALLTDASLLAAMMDTAVLVVRAGHTPLAAVKKAAASIGRARLMGIVLNRTHSEGPDAYYGSYYGAARHSD